MAEVEMFFEILTGVIVLGLIVSVVTTVATKAVSKKICGIYIWEN